MNNSFKWGLLLFLAVFLFLFWGQGQNGRYVALEPGGYSEILDTRTGRVYMARPCPWSGDSGPGCLNANEPPNGKKGGAQ